MAGTAAINPMDMELAIRLVIELFWIYACIYAVRSTKLIYWRQCWYIILAGCLIHTTYIMVALAVDIPYVGAIRNIGMAIVAIGIMMLARRMKAIMG
ncbi:MAG: hypothetical protein ACXQTY_05290 [Candidatus Methanogasteraceae archaeon]